MGKADNLLLETMGKHGTVKSLEIIKECKHRSPDIDVYVLAVTLMAADKHSAARFPRGSCIVMPACIRAFTCRTSYVGYLGYFYVFQGLQEYPWP